MAGRRRNPTGSATVEEGAGNSLTPRTTSDRFATFLISLSSQTEHFPFSPFSIKPPTSELDHRSPSPPTCVGGVADCGSYPFFFCAVRLLSLWWRELSAWWFPSAERDSQGGAKFPNPPLPPVQCASRESTAASSIREAAGDVGMVVARGRARFSQRLDL
ncbi:hypothetical protein BRADI_2g04727v3 [Brachypodium distachyon]|uniref:Uncharacterized protein n=1 Tax=Brachypodium distachyon TaxID=15368 RepID=A0A2K2D705_BRADI|nr:hypothetical protein BRADI_2g04727v3 [Brachypodium distachyon]